MPDDISRAAAIVAAEAIRTHRLSESDGFQVWRRQRGRMLSQLDLRAREEAVTDPEGPDDSAIFEPDDEDRDGDEASIQWSTSDDSSQAYFPSHGTR